MKRFLSLGLSLLLFLTSCNPSPTTEGTSSFKENNSMILSSQDTSVMNPSSEENSLNSSSSSIDQANGVQNTAVSILYPEYTPQPNGLFYVEELGTKDTIPWQTLNQVKNLERANYAPAVEEYEMYFLITPTYVGSSVRFYSMTPIPEAPYNIRNELVYEKTSTPDDYSVILVTDVPDISHKYEVDIEFNGRTVTHAFSYDGSGLLPSPEEVGGDSPYPFVTFEFDLEDYVLKGICPDSSNEGYDITFRALPPSAICIYDYGYCGISREKPVLEVPKSFTLKNGRTGWYDEERDSPPKYVYVLEENGIYISFYFYFYRSSVDMPPPPLTTCPSFDTFLSSLHLE